MALSTRTVSGGKEYTGGGGGGGGCSEFTDLDWRLRV